MAVTIQTRRDDSTDWSTANPVLALGEIGIETDTDKAKYGDGFTAWNDLPYWIDEGAQIPDGTVQGQTLRYNLTDDGWQATSDLIVDDAGIVRAGVDLPSFLPDSSLPTLDIRSLVGGTSALVNVTGVDGGGTIRVSRDEASLADTAPGTQVGQLMFRSKSSTSPGVPYQICSVRGSTDSDSGTGVVSFWTRNGAGTNGERMRIDSSGNLLVGKTAAGVGVVGGEIAASGGVIASTTPSGINIQTQKVGWTSGTDIVFRHRQDGTLAGDIRSDGNTLDFVATSDIALKENVADYQGALDEINALRPVTFNWKDTGRCGVGFIAQEVQEVYPDNVVKEGDYLMLSGMDKNYARLVKAIQELTARVEQLENG